MGTRATDPTDPTDGANRGDKPKQSTGTSRCAFCDITQDVTVPFDVFAAERDGDYTRS
ncbi:hypothetical protein [Embleya sp. NPDC005575]|uniref:hypothetical protein n=1 Tax=Embleya sp. NPDC005575 TaxID=3156892 RepID=UPI0033BC29DA